jgi:hypothetical protein
MRHGLGGNQSDQVPRDEQALLLKLLRWRRFGDARGTFGGSSTSATGQEASRLENILEGGESGGEGFFFFFFPFFPRSFLPLRYPSLPAEASRAARKGRMLPWFSPPCGPASIRFLDGREAWTGVPTAWPWSGSDESTATAWEAWQAGAGGSASHASKIISRSRPGWRPVVWRMGLMEEAVSPSGFQSAEGPQRP